MNNSNLARKPYPWLCPICKKREVFEAVVDHVVPIEYEGKSYSVHVEGLRTPKCRNCGEVCPDTEAYEQITLAFFRAAKLLTPAQIRHNRERLGLSKSQLAVAIGTEEAEVERWEGSGPFQPRTADNLLRLFFGMQPVRDVMISQQISSLAVDELSATP
jgi:putative zinc finger/helix-turn-helix YgiT family protein